MFETVGLSLSNRGKVRLEGSREERDIKAIKGIQHRGKAIF